MRVVIKAGLNTYHIGLGHTRRVRNNFAKWSTFPTRSSPFLGASPSAFPSRELPRLCPTLAGFAIAERRVGHLALNALRGGGAQTSALYPLHLIRFEG